jgi:hypothetical protein
VAFPDSFQTFSPRRPLYLTCIIFSYPQFLYIAKQLLPSAQNGINLENERETFFILFLFFLNSQYRRAVASPSGFSRFILPAYRFCFFLFEWTIIKKMTHIIKQKSKKAKTDKNENKFLWV